jgi:hypothetical protein
MSDEDYMMSAVIGEGIAICGIAPDAILATVDPEPCFNCKEVTVVRRFSGSGWYEDYFLCSNCGEDNGSGYRPFKRGWRKANIADALEWLKSAVDNEEFRAKTGCLIAAEMDWTEDAEAPNPE